MAARLIILISN